MAVCTGWSLCTEDDRPERETKMDAKEFMQIMMSEKGTKATKIINARNVEFTIYSCRLWVIEEILEGLTEELLNDIKESNLTETDIETVRKRKDHAKKDGLELFFKNVEKGTKRLYLLLGESGVGKSYAVAKRFPNAVTYACTKGIDPFSLLFNIEEGREGLAPKKTPFNFAMQNGEMVVMNEINELPHETLMFLQGITDESESVVIGSEYVKIGKGFKIVGTMNPPSETDERTPLGDALMKRAIGYVLRITDAVMCQRIGCPQEFLTKTRTLYNHISSNEYFVDMRRLTFRDFQSLWQVDFESQLEYLCCMGDIQNIIAYSDIKDTGEYLSLIDEIEAIKNV